MQPEKISGCLRLTTRRTAGSIAPTLYAKDSKMKTVLKTDPLTYEFASEQEAAEYDAWFRAKVEEALNSGKPPIPHDEVAARIRAKLAEMTKNAG